MAVTLFNRQVTTNSFSIFFYQVDKLQAIFFYPILCCKGIETFRDESCRCYDVPPHRYWPASCRVESLAIISQAVT